MAGRRSMRSRTFMLFFLFCFNFYHFQFLFENILSRDHLRLYLFCSIPHGMKMTVLVGYPLNVTYKTLLFTYLPPPFGDDVLNRIEKLIMS